MEAHIRAKLLHTLTEHDRKVSTKPGYNHYALGHYAKALQNVDELVSKGKNVGDAIRECFLGRLQTKLLKALSSCTMHADNVFKK